MHFYKVRTVAASELSRLLHSKVFVLSLVLVPAFAAGLAFLSSHYEKASPSPALASWLPGGSMVLLFAMVMLTTPQMMSSVIEEKMSRISEVLLASVTPLELMSGKLLACVGAAALVGLLYGALGGAYAAWQGYGGQIGLRALLYFAVFFLLAVLLNGSMYMAVGAACNEPKDAQGMLAPLVLASSVPLITLKALAQDPSGGLARVLSVFPLSAPFVMCFRINSLPLPSGGELALSIGTTLVATAFCIWAASRIFRVGLLARGKSPGVRQLWRWVFVRD